MIRIIGKGIFHLLLILFLVLISSCNTRYGHIPKVKKSTPPYLIKHKRGVKSILLASKPIALEFSRHSSSTLQINLTDTVNHAQKQRSKTFAERNFYYEKEISEKKAQHDTSNVVGNAVAETHLGIDNFAEVIVTMILGIAAILFFAAMAAAIIFIGAAIIANPLAIAFYGYMIAGFLLIMIVAGVIAKYFSGVRKKLEVYVSGKPYPLSEIKKMKKAVRVKHNFFNFVAALILTLFLSALFLAITNAIAPVSALLTFFGFWCLSGVTLFYLLKTVWLLLFISD